MTESEPTKEITLAIQLKLEKLYTLVAWTHTQNEMSTSFPKCFQREFLSSILFNHTDRLKSTIYHREVNSDYKQQVRI